MKNINKIQTNKKLLLTMGIIIVILSLSSVNALGVELLCLQKGQIVKFSLCDSTIKNKLCSSTSCKFCVNEISKGVYCPTNPNYCNEGLIKCNYLPGTSPQTNTVKPPFNITLINPVNNYSTYNTTIKFTFKLTNSANAASCGLLINGFAVAFNSSKITSSTNTISKTFAPGVYSWSIKCLDKKGIGSTSLSRNLIILGNQTNSSATSNVTTSNVLLVNPINNYSVIGPKTILFEYKLANYTKNITSCSLLINGSIYASNSSKITNLTNNFTKELSPGIYNWGVRCADKSNKIWQSENRLLIISNMNNTNISLPQNSTLNQTSETENNSLNVLANSNEEQTRHRGGGGGYCVTKWNCTDWEECKDGFQVRTCGYPINWCKPASDKPVERRNCAIILPNKDKGNKNLSTSNEMNLSSKKSAPHSLFGITGAAIGVGGSDNRIIVGIIIIMVIILALSYYVHTKKSR